MKYIPLEKNKKLNKTDVINFYKIIIALQLLLSIGSVRTGRQVVVISSSALLVVFIVYGFVILCLRVFKKFPSEKENNVSIAMLCLGYSAVCSVGFALIYSEKLYMFFLLLVLMAAILVVEYLVIRRIYNKKSKEVSTKNDPLSSVMLGVVSIIGGCFGVFYPVKDFNLVMVIYYFAMSVLFAFSYSNVFKAKELDQLGDGSVSCDEMS